MADQAMMQALLKTYGAAPTPRNIAQAQQFFASNPDQLERRAMGMRGSDGNNDNTDLLGPMLDKLMVESGAAPATTQAQVQEPESNPVIAKTTRSTTAPAPAPKAKSATDAEMNAQLPKPNDDTAPPRMHGDSGSSWFNNVLESLLGASSVAGRALMAPGAKGVPATVTPQIPGGEVSAMPGAYDALPNARAGQKLLTGPQKLLTGPVAVEETPSVVKSDPALEAQGKKAQLQAEIDAENQSLSEMQKAQQKKVAEQNATRDLVRDAKKAVGRK